jgi:hypothetical protein
VLAAHAIPTIATAAAPPETRSEKYQATPNPTPMAAQIPSMVSFSPAFLSKKYADKDFMFITFKG